MSPFFVLLIPLWFACVLVLLALDIWRSPESSAKREAREAAECAARQRLHDARKADRAAREKAALRAHLDALARRFEAEDRDALAGRSTPPRLR